MNVHFSLSLCPLMLCRVHSKLIRTRQTDRLSWAERSVHCISFICLLPLLREEKRRVQARRRVKREEEKDKSPPRVCLYPAANKIWSRHARYEWAHIDWAYLDKQHLLNLTSLTPLLLLSYSSYSNLCSFKRQISEVGASRSKKGQER